MNAKEARG